MSIKWNLARQKAAEESRRLSFTSHIDLNGLDKVEPNLVIDIIRRPSIQNYTSLKKFLSKCNRRWLEKFLNMDGMEVLLETMEILCDQGCASVADAFIQLECILCIKAILNSTAGIEYITDCKQASRLIAKALNSESVMVRKQIVEILSAISMYSAEGRDVVMEALENFKVSLQLRSKFPYQIIIDELRDENITAYKATLVTFVNCVLRGEEDIDRRILLRNEMIGYGLLDVINKLRLNDDDKDLEIQIATFDEELSKDEHQLLELIDTPREDSFPHFQLFNAIFIKVIPNSSFTND
ncbi:uncharacterized protein TRIADDRAFT_25420 [Trichoplax adhaerens]|uniref:GBD/FH3 domain-containing protein n=1 Tax=Trichoplax adhaerens TaxID=10228 RepID=B3RYM3_TRIAD|nr:hypothetical protein TRIADDRAFT_25420 [Trichoplax adhaerens]EDV24622.1 hypothetical protein TRIADDRAFT_25420 [Trichoplax adhaerens]|eukprot:XP_002112512.1 hypothetical protein TRIADDRAFT_25420 [Trichoplax adhaerens]